MKSTQSMSLPETPKRQQFVFELKIEAGTLVTTTQLLRSVGWVEFERARKMGGCVNSGWLGLLFDPEILYNRGISYR